LPSGKTADATTFPGDIAPPPDNVTLHQSHSRGQAHALSAHARPVGVVFSGYDAAAVQLVKREEILISRFLRIDAGLFERGTNAAYEAPVMRTNTFR